jgi:hypothetical protein
VRHPRPEQEEAREGVRLDLHDLAAECAELLGTSSDIDRVEIDHDARGGLREKRFERGSPA